MDLRIAGIAVVAVLIALAVSYVTTETNDDTTDVRTDLIVGDYIEYTVTKDTNLASIQTLYYESFVEEYLSPDLSEFEKTGTEEFTLGSTKIICDRYEVDDSKVLLDPVTGIMMAHSFIDEGMEVDERLTDTNYPLDSPLSEDKIIGKYFKYTQTVDGDSAVITYKFLSSMGEGVYMMTFAKEAHVLSQYKDVVADIDGDFLFLEDGTKITKDAFLALLDYNTFKDSLEASGMDIKPEWTERIDTPFGPRKVSVLSGQGGTETCTVYHVGDRIYRSVDAQNGSFGSLAFTIEVLSSSLLQ